MTETFKAYLLREGEDRKVSGAFEDVPVADLPEGDVTVRVGYSTVNYKDGMVVNGLGNLVRNYPHVPGIDFAGTVEASCGGSFALASSLSSQSEWCSRAHCSSTSPEPIAS